jgi:hypothetical protein
MPTRPATPDPASPTGADAGAGNPFATLGAGLGAGLDFFQDWLKAAGSALPNMPGAAAGAQGMSSWTMPTLDPAELDKRIQDLKTVQFWLEQNARMIAMTIQGLEVQRMTLSTLQGMNVSMDALRESLKSRAEAAPAAHTAGGSDDQPAGTGDQAAESAASPDLINPMRWWDTLTQQFTHLASQAAQTVGDSVGESMDMLKQAQAKATEMATQGVAAAAPQRRGTGASAKSASAAKKAAARKRARSTSAKAQDKRA